MKKRTLTTLVVAAALLAHGMAFRTLAQESSAQGGGSVSINNQAGRVQIKLERGSRVSISNRYGRITITGWDRDTVEATATSSKGAEAVSVEMTADPEARSVLALSVPGRPGQRTAFAPFVYSTTPLPLKGVYTTAPPAPEQDKATPAKPPKPTTTTPKAEPGSNVVIVPVPDAEVTPAPGQAPAKGAGSGSGVGTGKGSGVGESIRGAVREAFGAKAVSAGSSINLDVKMPRYAQLDAIEVRNGDISISDLDGPVSISSGSSNISVNRVGSLEVRARGGNVNVEGVDGLVYIVASSGAISVKRTSGDVRATSINGDIQIQCVRGRVDASNARGGITLAGVDGDVEASTTDAEINFTSAIRPQGRYRLKSMEGRVVMAIPENSPGFTAILASYNNEVVTNFPVSTEVLAGGSTRVNRRVVVKQGDGQAQITLDSFSQPVQLTKLASGTTTTCK